MLIRITEPHLFVLFVSASVSLHHPYQASHMTLFLGGRGRSRMDLEFFNRQQLLHLEWPIFPLTDEWIGKIRCIYMMEYYSAIKKNKIIPFVATWMELETLLLSEAS